MLGVDIKRFYLVAPAKTMPSDTRSSVESSMAPNRDELFW